MAQPDLPYPSFLDQLADIFERARPYEKTDGEAVTWNIHLKFIYHEHGAGEALRNVILVSQALDKGNWWCPYFTSVSYVLADASREGTRLIIIPMEELISLEPWRLMFGDYGILDFYFDLLPGDGYNRHPWIKHALRLIGNCCAESSSKTPNTR